MTANLGIERIVRAVLSAPCVTALLVCGRDSILFGQGQSLVALFRQGLERDGPRIAGATGHRPLLAGVSPRQVEAFRRQVDLIDQRGVSDVEALRAIIGGLAGEPLPTQVTPPGCLDDAGQRFRGLPPGGRRRPLAAAAKGFFVIDVDPPDIVVRHYLENLAPGHEVRGRRAETLVLRLIEGRLVDELSHAAYLGVELGKAELALRLGLVYVQDRPLERP